MKETLRVDIRDASRFRVKSASKILVKADSKSFPLTGSGTGPTAEIDVTGANSISIQVTNDEYSFFSATFAVTRDPATGVPSLTRQPTASVFGYADILGLNFTRDDPRFINLATIHLTALDDASSVASIDANSISAIHVQMPHQPTISTNASATHWDCLPHDELDLTAPGRFYVFTRAGSPPNLIGVWRPDYLSVTDEPGPLGYHFYFPPIIDQNAKTWGKYPLGDPSNRGYVNLLVRHMFTEFALANKTHQARCKNLVVIVADVVDDNFSAWTPSCAHLLRLLQEVNMFVHLVENADYHTWIKHEVGRVAMSAFSGGLENLVKVLENVAEDGDRPGLVSAFRNENLKELYDFDGENVTNDRLLAAFDGWRGKNTDRCYRIYHQDPAWENSLSHFAGVTPATKTFGGVLVGEAHDGDSRSLVVLPKPFLTAIPIADPHHWMMAYFSGHAITMSKFGRG